jgi:hypothetical protein
MTAEVPGGYPSVGLPAGCRRPSSACCPPMRKKVVVAARLGCSGSRSRTPSRQIHGSRPCSLSSECGLDVRLRRPWVHQQGSEPGREATGRNDGTEGEYFNLPFHDRSMTKCRPCTSSPLANAEIRGACLSPSLSTRAMSSDGCDSQDNRRGHPRRSRHPRCFSSPVRGDIVNSQSTFQSIRIPVGSCRLFGS